MRQQVRQSSCVVAAALCTFFTLLGGPYLWDEDEPKNAECAREMLEAGDWVVPRFNYQLRTDKPVLLYWLQMAAYQAFGVNEFAARLASAAAAVGTALLTFHLGRRLYGGDVGLWSGLAMAGCVMFAVTGRAATPDSLLIFCTTLALYLFVRFGGVADGRLSRGGHAAMYAAMATAVLAKGPVGVVLPLGVIGLFLLLRHDPSHAATGSSGGVPVQTRIAVFLAKFAPRRILAVTWSLRPLTLLALSAVIALPWYVLVGLRTDCAWLVGFFGTHNVGRFTGAMEGHSGPIVYYVVAILVGFFPWSCLLPSAIYRLVRRLRSGAVEAHDPAARHADVFLACWIGLYVVFFSLAGTKLPSYVLPCYPALAVLTGKFVDEWLARRAKLPRYWLAGALATPAVVGLVLLVGLPIAAKFLLPGDEWLGVVGLPLLLGGLGFAWALRRGRPGLVPLAFAAMSTAFVTTLVGPAAEGVSRRATSPAIVRAAHERTGGAAPLVAFRHYEPTLVFYARGEVPTIDTPEQLRAELRRRPGAVVVTRDEFLDELAAALGEAPQTAVRYPRFLRRRGEVVLVIPPADGVAAAPTSVPQRR